MTLDQYTLPEILRTRLEEVILKIKILELGKASYFLEKVMDSPESAAHRPSRLLGGMSHSGAPCGPTMCVGIPTRPIAILWPPVV